MFPHSPETDDDMGVATESSTALPGESPDKPMGARSRPFGGLSVERYNEMVKQDLIVLAKIVAEIDRQFKAPTTGRPESLRELELEIKWVIGEWPPDIKIIDLTADSDDKTVIDSGPIEVPKNKAGQTLSEVTADSGQPKAKAAGTVVAGASNRFETDTAQAQNEAVEVS